MKIPLPEEAPNIYNFGFGADLNRELTASSSGVIFDKINEGINTSQILPGGDLNLKTLTIGGLVKQVAPGDDIQSAIDAVSREGGGIVQLLAGTYLLNSDINLKSKVGLVGAGRDITVIDFRGQAFGIFCKGGSSTDLITNVLFKDFTAQNSNQTAGIDIDYTDIFRVENVRSFSCDQKGIRVQHSQVFYFLNVLADSNTGNGIEIIGDSTRKTSDLTLLQCLSNSNGVNGIVVTTTGTTLNSIFLTNCRASSNTGIGFSTTGIGQVRIVNCVATSNSGDGFDSSCTALVYYGCDSTSNGGKGFDVRSANQAVIACTTNGNTGVEYDFSDGIFLGNKWASAGGLPSTDVTLSIPEGVVSGFLGRFGSPVLDSYSFYMKNVSGGGVPTGAVVVLASTTDGESVNTTTTNGDNKVLGMMYDDSLGTTANNGINTVLTRGKTSRLMVNNGATSISVGDYLSAWSHAYYAKKAVAGDTVFAMALESPSVGTQQISALLISPRLI